MHRASIPPSELTLSPAHSGSLSPSCGRCPALTPGSRHFLSLLSALQKGARSALHNSYVAEAVWESPQGLPCGCAREEGHPGRGPQGQTLRYTWCSNAASFGCSSLCGSHWSCRWPQSRRAGCPEAPCRQDTAALLLLRLQGLRATGDRSHPSPELCPMAVLRGATTLPAWPATF